MLGRADDVDEEHRREEPVVIVGVDARAGDELLDEGQEIGVGKQPVIGALALGLFQQARVEHLKEGMVCDGRSDPADASLTRKQWQALARLGSFGRR